MKVLVTGDKGFVGSETCRGSSSVIGYDLMDGYDVRDVAQLHRVIESEGIDRILHLAAIARFADADADPLRAHSTNVVGTANVVAAAEEHHIPLVYASTGSVYMPIERTPPITEDFPSIGNSVYGVTKNLADLMVQRCSAPWIVLRYAHLYGLEKRLHGLVGGVLSRIERGLAPILYGGAQSNDFTYISDVARANWLALTAPWDAWNQVYNIGTGEELSTEAAFNMVLDIFGYDKDGDVLVDPQRPVDADRFVYDTTKAEAQLGFRATFDFRAGLEDMRDRSKDAGLAA